VRRRISAETGPRALVRVSRLRSWPKPPPPPPWGGRSQPAVETARTGFCLVSRHFGSSRPEPLAPPRHCDGPPAVPTAGWLRPTAHCTHSGLMILLAQQNPSPAPVNPFGRSDTTSHHYPSVSFFHTAASAPPTDSCSAGLQRSFRCTAAVRAGRRCVSVHQCNRHRRRPALPLYFSRSRIYLVPLPSFPQVEVPELGPHPGLIPPPRSSWSEQTTYSLNTAVVFVHSLLTLRV
jgi:hypothetical protein